MNQFLRYTSILILFFVSVSSIAQESNCAFKLQEAEDAYESGVLDSIPSMLRACVNNDGFDDEELARAYRLLIKTYLFEDYQEMAELTMLKFLKKFPEYKIKPTDPVEFTYLYKSYQTIPLYSIGFIFGGNYSFVRIIEPFTVGNAEGKYSSALNLQFGLQIKRYINENIELNLDGIYTLKGFHYEITQSNSLTVYDEKQTTLSFPLSGTYDFKLGTWSPFLRAGINVDYLLAATADFSRKTINNNTVVVKESDIDILVDRNALNISAMIGGGLKYNTKKGYVMMDLRYHFGFMNIVNGDNRYIYETKGSAYYCDDDFALNNLFISVGYVFSFYQTKQNK